ncbi:MAG: T9SS type A sorting domain-containing protein [bacterium]|nr:T9SS type A sorting domain-containing protein [bacterium]
MIPIPVELISFTAKVVKNKVILNWSTATELNNLGFEIERKTTGEFYTIGFTEGQGSTTEIHNYSFTDYYPERGNNYYRLKQIDYNGNFNYSEEIELNFDIPEFFSLEQNYPNPFNPSTVIIYQMPVSSDVTLKVFDVLGNEVATLVNEYKPAGTHEVEFNTSSINQIPSSGVYFYQVKAGEFVSTKKMILLR